MAEKILVIDDEKTILEFLSFALENQGFQVILAQSGREGLNIFRREAVDLILTDLRLPDINGLEILKKAKDLDSQIEVIVLTGFVTDENKKMAFLNGAFSFLGKPLDSLEELYSDVRNALKKRKLNLEQKPLLTLFSRQVIM